MCSVPPAISLSSQLISKLANGFNFPSSELSRKSSVRRSKLEFCTIQIRKVLLENRFKGGSFQMIILFVQNIRQRIQYEPLNSPTAFPLARKSHAVIIPLLVAVYIIFLEVGLNFIPTIVALL